MSNSKYPNFKIFQENDFDFNKLKISEIGGKDDIKLLDEWLESKTYNNARTEELISYRDDGRPVDRDIFLRTKNQKDIHKIKKCKQDSHLLDEILKPRKECVIFLKFFAEVIREIELMKKEKKVTDIINSSFNDIVHSIKRFAVNEYQLSLHCDPYVGEQIIWRDIVIEQCKDFFKWKFRDDPFNGQSWSYGEEEKMLLKFFDKNFEKTSKENFINKRQTFRRVAKQRMNTIRNEMRKFGNLSDRSNYKYTQSEIQEIWTSLTNIINHAFKGFRPIGLANPYNIPTEIIDVGCEGKFKRPFEEQKLVKSFEENVNFIKPQTKDPKSSDLNFELKSLKESMEKKFTELELKIKLSKDKKKND